jgi:hypothetical protein
MKGYKIFNHDWTSESKYQGETDQIYEVGQIYKISNDQIALNKKGFHFRRLPYNVCRTNFGDENKYKYKYLQIEASGQILQIDNECVCSQIKIIKELSVQELEELGNGILIGKDGSKLYCLKGQLHREDGPAVEEANGDKHWFLNGKRHRENGPAIEKLHGNIQ